MPLAKRVIPCLDVNAGRVVKGVNFVDLRDAGDPVEIAARYDEQGADEVCFLDITASSDQRDLILHIIEAVAERVFIPLTVGGGVRRLEDVRRLLNAGADKVSINTAAVQNPELVREASGVVGCQCIVVAIDAKKKGASWEVFTHGGRRPTGLDAIEWAKKIPFHLMPSDGRTPEVEIRQFFELEDFPEVPPDVAKQERDFLKR